MPAITALNIRNEREAFAYLVECTLATVSQLAGLARPPKGELNRQISIAQTGIDWLRAIERHEGGRNWSGCGRTEEILATGIDVASWANRLRA